MVDETGWQPAWVKKSRATRGVQGGIYIFLRLGDAYLIAESRGM